MSDVPFPLLNAPGRQPQVAGGRLINCYPEKLPATAGKPYAYWRTPGLKPWGTTTGSNYRGALLVGGTLYAVVGTSVWTFPSGGGAGTLLTGTLPGTSPVTMARNNATTPDIVIVAPGDGAFVVTGAGVASYPDIDVGQPNAVVFHKGFFIFTYGDGKTRSSGVNSTSINTLDVATAESKPDTLYRPIPLGNGQLLLCGSNSMEVWGGANEPGVAGYPFNYVASIARGITGAYAIAGHDDGFGKGIFFVGDDFKISTLSAYTPTPISTPDLDLLIEAEADKSLITVSVYVSQGHGVVVVQGPAWCWEYDTTLQTWHERKSHLQAYWRGLFPLLAFGKWICGDKKTGNLAQIDGLTNTEFGDPLLIQIDTGPLGAFPNKVRINALELYLTKGVGRATGSDPLETNPDISIAVSRDGGQTYSNPRVVKIGKQSLTDQRVRAGIWGQAQNQGVRWRLRESAPLNFAFMGADMQVDQLR